MADSLFIGENTLAHEQGFVCLDEFQSPEVWKDVVGYEGLYRVSSSGRILSLPRKRNSGASRSYITKEKILYPVIDSHGYFVVNLWKGQKPILKKVHRLVALTFIGGEGVVNHKDGIKTNNHTSNLELTSPKENSHHAVKNQLIPCKIRKEDVQDIHMYWECGNSVQEIANRYKVPYQTIKMVLNNKMVFCQS